MIKIEHTHVSDWEAALRGMRNPKNSWSKSDSLFKDFYNDYEDSYVYYDIMENRYLSDTTPLPEEAREAFENDTVYIGPNDMKLAKTLVAGGPVHAKFRRFISVSADITAPLYWWKDFDTYRIGRADQSDDYNPHDTEYNGCSTMHKIHTKEFTLDDFSCEHLLKDEDSNTPGIEEIYGVPVHMFDEDKGVYAAPLEFYKHTVDFLNHLRNVYLRTKDKRIWWQMIQLLPSSYNQRRTVKLNYEVLAGLYPMRKTHKLDEFRDFCKWIETLPYAKELIIGEEKTGDTVEQPGARIKQYKDRIDYLKQQLAKELYNRGVPIEEAIKIIEDAGENKLRDTLTGKGVHDHMKKMFPECFKEESDVNKDNV